MTIQFPAAPDEKRAMLLAAVDRVADDLAAGVGEGEKLRTLSPSSVAALRDTGLYMLKFPAALGGAEADPVTQLEVIEAVSYLNPGAGWCLAICADVLGFAGAYLPDSALAEMMADGRPPMMAGTLMPGKALAVPGGYELTGRWSWGSGIRHAGYVSAQALVAGEQGGPPRVMNCFFPASAARVIDNWHVMGMEATGSCDFEVEDLFVPEDFAYDIGASRPRRGGAIYRLGWPGYVINVASGAGLGMGKRALHEIVALAQSKRRGYGKKVSLGQRGVFQRALAEGDLKMQAARGLMLDLVGKAWRMAQEDGEPGSRLQAEMRAAATLVTDVALEVTTMAFRYAGGTAVFSDHVLSRCLRNLQVISSHLLISDIAYEQYGQFLLGEAAAPVAEAPRLATARG